MVTDQLIIAELELLDMEMLSMEQKYQEYIEALPELQRMTARNLVHYLALRSNDIRDLQDHLHMKGLSSLMSSESHIRSQLQAILKLLGKSHMPKEPWTYELSQKTQKERTDLLFGKKDNDLIPHVMVTFDSGFADNYPLIHDLLLNGMTIARINCAHDQEEVWSKMIRQLRQASEVTGISCKIYMDLAGPKIRTTILGKGREEGMVFIEEDALILLSENNHDFPGTEVVLGCTIPGVIKQLEIGHKVLFDDGVVETEVEKLEPGQAHLRIKRISGKKPRIKAEKGINFPDSHLDISALTDYDLECIPFMIQHADMIGYSFVRNAQDLMELQSILDRYPEKQMPIILKIETQEAVKNLPSLLLQGMQRNQLGVMIARGDLAIEIGFERLSEVQEEILWICEAAHVPAIWATQVLENMNKSGLATRAEVTDAAHATMAECVMINKGDHLIRVLKSLKDILQRHSGHRDKKRFLFRPLKIAQHFFSSADI